MSKPRRTPIPLPGSKSKIVPPSSKSALSQEFINDSDDSAAETAQSKKTTQKKAAVTIAVHRPKNGVVEEKSKAAAKKQKEKEKESLKSASKAKAEVKKPAPKQVETEDGTSSSSSEEDESEEEPETDIKKAQKREQEKKKASASSSDSDSTSESSSEEESDEESTPPSAPKPIESHHNPTPTKSHAVDFVAARPYVPPRDYHPCSTGRAHTTHPTTLFNNLSGKQIWHITAPSGVSLKSLKDIVSMEQALTGSTPILTHKSTNYGFTDLSQDDTPSTSAASKSEAVIIPGQNGYTPITLPISQTLHIRELVSLPALSSHQADPNTGSEAAASITRSTIRAPRPQLKGLKMRYFPSGVSDHDPVVVGSDDEEEQEQEDAAASTGKQNKKSKKGGNADGEGGLAVPKVKHIISAGKRKLDADEDGDVQMEEPVKKVKKSRTEGEKKSKKEKDKKKKKA